MRVHSVKHGRYDACRVSVSALFVMTSFFSCSVSLLCVLYALSPLARFPSFVLCPAWYAGVTKAGQPRANRIPLLYPCYTLTIFLHFAYKTIYFDRFLPENLRMCKKSSIFA